LDLDCILDQVDFYREAPAELQAEISAASRYMRLAPREWLFREGDPVSQFVTVGRGAIRVSRIGATGREITLYHVREGQSSLVGMLSVLLESPAIAAARAEVETEAVVLPAAALRDWVSTSDAMRNFVLGTMARALVDVTTVLEDIAFRTIQSRLAALLLQHFATTRVLLMTHEEIAAELGTAREVVSRLMESYERIGAIHLSRGRIEIRDEAALGRLV
jgi:CRP/FNR family transcriptional regulator, anaerobic regulatory protein